MKYFVKCIKINSRNMVIFSIIYFNKTFKIIPILNYFTNP